jgi:hypothetical protein
VDYVKTAEKINDFAYRYFPELLFENRWHYANRLGNYQSLASVIFLYFKNRKKPFIARIWEYYFGELNERYGIDVPEGLPTFQAYDFEKRSKYLVVSSLPTLNFFPKTTTIGILFLDTNQYRSMPNNNIGVNYFAADYDDSDRIFVVKEIDENISVINTCRYELDSNEYVEEELLKNYIYNTKIKDSK